MSDKRLGNAHANTSRNSHQRHGLSWKALAGLHVLQKKAFNRTCRWTDARLTCLQCSRDNPCKQCVRKGLPCGGYQTVFDLAIRDQPSHVIQDVISPAFQSQSLQVTVVPESMHSAPLMPESVNRIGVPNSLTQSVVDIAVVYLFNSYWSKSSFDYLLDMFDEFATSKCFISSAQAVALANYARSRQDGNLLNDSRKIYVKAIKEVNTALKSEDVANNSTLVATQILGMFETALLNDENASASSSRSCIASWIAHTNGTMSLIRFRGDDLLGTEMGKKVYYQVANKIRAICAQQNVRLPGDFVTLDKQMAPLLLHMDPSVRVWPIIDMLIELLARTQGKNRMSIVSFTNCCRTILT
jgi:Fungal specific transcription factor domain